MSMHYKKAFSRLVLFKTMQNNTEKHTKKDNFWRRESWTTEMKSWDEKKDWLDQEESALVQLPNQTSRDYSIQSGLLRGIFVPPCQTSKILHLQSEEKG